MHTQTFTYIPTKVGEPMLVRIDQDDEVHHVTIGDCYLGDMEEDENAPHGWLISDNWPLLKEEIAELSMAIREEKAIFNLPYALKELFPDDLLGWDWNDDESLKLIAQPFTDLAEFASVIRDQITEVVLFDKNLIIYLSKEGSSEIEEIIVN